jgi:hypothetical protein
MARPVVLAVLAGVLVEQEILRQLHHRKAITEACQFPAKAVAVVEPVLLEEMEWPLLLGVLVVTAPRQASVAAVSPMRVVAAVVVLPAWRRVEPAGVVLVVTAATRQPEQTGWVVVVVGRVVVITEWTAVMVL